MVDNASNKNFNELREILYGIARQDMPEYVWQWFLRYFAGAGLEPERYFKNEPKDLLENYYTLFSMGMELLKNKYSRGAYSKFIKDPNPSNSTYYFIGDTHGSFIDTYQIIDYLIKAVQINSNIKIVFLGDYVDRNPFDLQNLAFILSFWIIFPDNVFLIRGNHEDSSVCSRYGFSQHLFDKTESKDRFTPIWELIIEFFSKLPIGIICKVGNLNILGVHGGIPFDLNDYKPLKLQEIEPNLNCYQKEHFEMDKFSQTILWADPDPSLIEGVAPNSKTGRPRFSEQAFNDFMRLNQFDLLIRGHQKFSEGYKLLWDNRLISLFSTSTYDGRNIGHAKFLRIAPGIECDQFGEEQLGNGYGILDVNTEFLDNQILKYYNGNIEKG
ncbi:MAG: metallophosphoesterase family protein [Promethearchaeota archaeon]